MVTASLSHRVLLRASFILLFGGLLAALIMLTAAARHSEFFGRYYSILLIINILGIVLLLGLIVPNLWRLIQQYRDRKLGSRLTLRMLGTFAGIALLPLVIVYYFSVQFLSEGIDSWFNVRITRALDDARLLGRTTLETVKQDALQEARQIANTLTDESDIVSAINDIRQQHQYDEMTLFGYNGQIIASSSIDQRSLLPDRPPEFLLNKLRAGTYQINLEPLADDSIKLRILVPVFSQSVIQPLRILQIIRSLPLRHAKLSASLESAVREYKQIKYLRQPLKFTFVLTLSLIALATLLMGIWAGIFSSRKLIKPLRDLAMGTRAVAAGNYDTTLPVTQRDEFGVLVESFNDMTRKIQSARDETQKAQRESDAQRTYLQTVLSHLSSGVMSVDSSLHLRTFNPAAEEILGLDLRTARDHTLEQITTDFPEVTPLWEQVNQGISNGEPEWQAEISLNAARGRRILIIRGSLLRGSRSTDGGYVVVFDEITDMVQAQRNAAWGEVARRLAHEIKNPLTPIQLSAERIRNKYLHTLPADNRDALERATRIIVQQVDAMKQMVNAFSDYAQPVLKTTADVDLNQLVSDVAELHRGKQQPTIHLHLSSAIKPVIADTNRILQVLNNLIINACDALQAPEQPSDTPGIDISTMIQQDSGREYVELTVADNGPGFSRKLRSDIFEPYVTTKTKGTGLGLAIVKRIIEEHGGKIWASVNLPHGVVVTVLLPVGDSIPATQIEPKHSPKGQIET